MDERHVPEVELVQVSCPKPDLLTGTQLSHFGAFYRPSWRVSDWIRGRREGARQILRLVLSPDRLQQLGMKPDPLYEQLRDIAKTSVDGVDKSWMIARWKEYEPEIKAELTAALDTEPTGPTPLTTTARLLATPIEVDILRHDLGALIDALLAERDRTGAGDTFLELARIALASGDRDIATLSAEELWELGGAPLDDIGRDQVSKDYGSDTFARTVSHAAAVGASVAGSTPKITSLKPVAAVAKSARGYLLAVWAMVSYLTRGSRIGPRIVSGAVAVGGTLMAITLFVPGVPPAVIVTGAGLVLAGLTTSALRTRSALWLGMLLAALLAGPLALLGRYIYLRVNNGDTDALTSIGIKVGVTILILGIGSWLAIARPFGAKPDRSRAERKEDRRRERARAARERTWAAQRLKADKQRRDECRSRVTGLRDATTGARLNGDPSPRSSSTPRLWRSRRMRVSRR